MDKIKKIPWILGRNAFLFILIFILLSIILGQFLFYEYVFLVKIEEPKMSDITAKFQESIYRAVLRELDARESVFENPPQKNYPNPFL